MKRNSARSTSLNVGPNHGEYMEPKPAEAAPPVVNPALDAYNKAFENINVFLSDANCAFILVATEVTSPLETSMINSNVTNLDARVRLMARALKALKDQQDQARRGTRKVT